MAPVNIPLINTINRARDVAAMALRSTERALDTKPNVWGVMTPTYRVHPEVVAASSHLEDVLRQTMQHAEVRPGLAQALRGHADVLASTRAVTVANHAAGRSDLNGFAFALRNEAADVDTLLRTQNLRP